LKALFDALCPVHATEHLLTSRRRLPGQRDNLVKSRVARYPRKIDLRQPRGRATRGLRQQRTCDRVTREVLVAGAR
jgi:hypothetical protein